MTKRIGLVLLALVSIVLPIFASDTPDEYRLVGYGSETRGGLDGRIIKVTTLNATGEGSFTEALNAEGPRTIVFEVAGVIDLGKQQIDITEPYLTIAGQTAPSPGITLIRGGLTVRTHDVVIQHIRFRMGDAGAEKGEKYEPEISTYGAEAYNIVVDHCSVSWGVDENLSTSGPRLDGPEATSHNLTFSNNIIAEPLCYSVHSKDGNHGMGTLVHDNCTNVTIIGNYYAHNYERNPWYKGGCTGIVLNNLIYNPGKWAMRMGYVPKEWNNSDTAPVNPRVTIIGNYMKTGVDTPETTAMVGTNYNNGDCYLEDNIAIHLDGSECPITDGNITILDEKPSWIEGLEVLPAKDVPMHVLANAGARPKDRDAIDMRLVNEFITGTGNQIDSQNEVGGYPEVEPVYRALELPSENESIESWLVQYTAQVQ